MIRLKELLGLISDSEQLHIFNNKEQTDYLVVAGIVKYKDADLYVKRITTDNGNIGVVIAERNKYGRLE